MPHSLNILFQEHSCFFLETFFFSLLRYLDCESIQSNMMCEYTAFAWVHTNQEMAFEFLYQISLFFVISFLISCCIPIGVDGNTGHIAAIWKYLVGAIPIDIDENITVKWAVYS